MDDLRAFYVERYREADRLWQSPHGVLERVRTQELLARHLPPPPGAVLDVGGGTGVHADWLAERGYDVVLVDVIAEHVAEAAVRGGHLPVRDADGHRRRRPPDRGARADGAPSARHGRVPDGLGFTQTYFHAPDELGAELTDAGLREVFVYGIEGPAAPALDARGLDALPDHLDAAVRAARLVETDPALIAASGHLLAVGSA